MKFFGANINNVKKNNDFIQQCNDKEAELIKEFIDSDNTHTELKKIIKSIFEKFRDSIVENIKNYSKIVENNLNDKISELEKDYNKSQEEKEKIAADAHTMRTTIIEPFEKEICEYIENVKRELDDK